MTTEEKLISVMSIPVSVAQETINGHRINYAVAGKGPALILIHGANFGWGVWYPNIPEFAKHFTVYAIDLPGAGRSSRVDYSKLDPKRDLEDVVSQFITEHNLQNVTVIGCSIGGWLALRMALKYPKRISKVIVENSVGFKDYIGFSDKMIGFYPFARLISKTVLKPGAKNSEKFLRGIFYDRMLNLKQEFIDYFCETMETSHNLLFISRLTALNKEFLLEQKLPQLRQKTLIVWGEEDRIMPLNKNIDNFKLIPNVEVVIMKNAGHIPSLEKPQEFNNAISVFLKPEQSPANNY